MATRVLCFGEMLWDALPAGLFPGGAPMNVGYHLKQLGLDPFPVSAVGKDRLGSELMRRVRGWGVSTEQVREHVERESGFVQAEIDEQGNAHYTIVEGVAWDEIEVKTSLIESASEYSAVVFGSLAQRSTANQVSLKRLLDAMPGREKIFDVNLRPPFVDHGQIFELGKRATLVKLNAEEAAQLLGRGDASKLEENAREIGKRMECERVCVTAAENGSGFLDHGNWYREEGVVVEVEDTVGAGDSFLGALVRGVLETPDAPKENLKRAARLGEWVATQRGATPDYGGRTF